MSASFNRLPLRGLVPAYRITASSTTKAFSVRSASLSTRNFQTLGSSGSLLSKNGTALLPATQRYLSFTSIHRQDVADAAAVADQASSQQPAQAQEESEYITPQYQVEGSLPITYEKRKPKDQTFNSMKGWISYSTWKALTEKPFHFKDMSLVQKSVLHLMPELVASEREDVEPMSDGQGRDILVKAKTGTGKTVAFLVPAIEARLKMLEDCRKGIFTQPWKNILLKHRPNFVYEELDKMGRQTLVRQCSQNTVGTLILSPTRELATQIAAEAKKLLHHHKDLEVHLLVGGASRPRQILDWRKGRPDIVVATPGRMADLLQDIEMIREAMAGCRTLVLDEADTLLEMGFRSEIEKILGFLPDKQNRQTMMFSATVSREIKSIARESLRPNPRVIDCVPEGEENTHKHIPQFCTTLEKASDQIPHILRLIAHDQLTNPGNSKVIVFAPTTKMTQMISALIAKARRILPIGPASRIYEIHSKKDQRARFNTSDEFRKNHRGGTVLVTSDVSARGVDYPGTTRVIQIGMPISKDQYIHRIGRTGRAGANGRADIVLQKWEQGFLHYQLQDLPVKQLTVSDLTDEVNELSALHDNDPAAFRPAPKYTERQLVAFRRERTFFETLYIQGPLGDRYQPEKLDLLAQEIVTQSFDESEISEVFTSLLGFYNGAAEDIRTSKTAIFDGLKRWAVEAGGLEKEPYVSRELLNKLGIREGNPRSGSRGFMHEGGSRGMFQNRAGGGRGGFSRSFDGSSSSRSGFRESSEDDSEPSSSFRERSSYLGGRSNSYSGGRSNSYSGGNDRGGNSWTSRGRSNKDEF